MVRSLRPVLDRSACTVRMSFLRRMRISRTAMPLASPRSAILAATAGGVAGSCNWAPAVPVSIIRAAHRAGRVKRVLMPEVPSLGMGSMGRWVGKGTVRLPQGLATCAGLAPGLGAGRGRLLARGAAAGVTGVMGATAGTTTGAAAAGGAGAATAGAAPGSWPSVATSPISTLFSYMRSGTSAYWPSILMRAGSSRPSMAMLCSPGGSYPRATYTRPGNMRHMRSSACSGATEAAAPIRPPIRPPCFCNWFCNTPLVRARVKLRSTMPGISSLSARRAITFTSTTFSSLKWAPAADRRGSRGAWYRVRVGYFLELEMGAGGRQAGQQRVLRWRDHRVGDAGRDHAAAGGHRQRESLGLAGRGVAGLDHEEHIGHALAALPGDTGAVVQTLQALFEHLRLGLELDGLAVAGRRHAGLVEHLVQKAGQVMAQRVLVAVLQGQPLRVVESLHRVAVDFLAARSGAIGLGLLFRRQGFLGAEFGNDGFAFVGALDVHPGVVEVTHGHAVERQARGQPDLFIVLAFIALQALADQRGAEHAHQFVGVGLGGVFPFLDLAVGLQEGLGAVGVAALHAQQLAALHVVQ